MLEPDEDTEDIEISDCDIHQDEEEADDETN